MSRIQKLPGRDHGPKNFCYQLDNFEENGVYSTLLEFPDREFPTRFPCRPFATATLDAN